MRDRVLIISLGWEQVPMLDMLAARDDIELYGVHYSKDYYQGVAYQEVIICEMLDFDTILAFAEKIKPTAVISDQDDYAYLAQALVAAKHKLPGPNVATSHLATNKFLQRERCQEFGIRMPRYQAANYAHEVRAFAKKNGFPIIVKPVDSRGSFGVSKVNSQDEVDQAFTCAMENSISSLVIAEEFIIGKEITVDGYCFNQNPKSLSLAEKGKIDGEKQVSVDIKYPGVLHAGVYQKAMENNECVCQALGFTFGMTHAEYIVDKKNDIYLVEAANRGGGCFTSAVIVPAVCGHDILEEYIENIFARSCYSQVPQDIQHNEVILKFFTFAPGKVKAIDGLRELNENPYVLEYRVQVRQGDTILPVTNDANRHGFVIVKADVNIRNLTDRLIDSIKVTYD